VKLGTEAGPQDLIRCLAFQGPMRSMEIIKIFPLCQFLIQIDVVFVAQQLIEFRFIGAVRAFHFAVESRHPRLDVDVMNA